MNKNTGIEYEIFTKEVYDYIIKEEGFKDIEVLHNVKKIGLSGNEHQIDIYFEYKFAGSIHSIAIECKDYKSRIPQEKIMAFKSKISDLKVNKGIFVSKMGFQKGAITYGEAYGIELIELKRPEDYNWKGLIKNIELKLNIYNVSQIKIIEIKADEEWKKLNKIGEVIFHYKGDVGELYFYNHQKEKEFSMLDLINKLPTSDLPLGTNRYTFNFTDKKYLYSDLEEIFIKIIYIIVEYNIEILETEIKVNAENSIKAIKREVLTGKEEFIKK